MPPFGSFHFFRFLLRGASFTEYLTVVGAIALLALGAFAQFSDTNRQHMANLSQELAGTPTSGPVAGGKLIAGDNRTRDINLQDDLFSVSIPSNACLSSEAENKLIENIFLINDYYGNNLGYALFPSSDNNFN